MTSGNEKTILFHLSILVLACMVLSCGCTNTAPDDSGPRELEKITGIQPGEGQYIFNDPFGNVDRPVTVFTYRPLTWNSSNQLLIIMHGAGRNGKDSMMVWKPYAERYSCLVVAPEFSEQYYPGDQWYIGGNMYSSSGRLNPKSNWTYTAIEHLFDDVKNRTGATQES